jgi:hypothetical protein
MFESPVRSAGRPAVELGFVCERCTSLDFHSERIRSENGLKGSTLDYPG